MVVWMFIINNTSCLNQLIYLYVFLNLFKKYSKYIEYK